MCANRGYAAPVSVFLTGYLDWRYIHRINKQRFGT